MSVDSGHESSKSLSIAEIAEAPPREPRRSSIFRPHMTATVKDEQICDAFSDEYIGKLKQENILWKATYAAVKDEYSELIKQMKENEALVDGARLEHPTNLTVYDGYVKEAEDFIKQVNCIGELNKHASKVLKTRKRQLERDVQASSKIILRELFGKPKPE